MNVSEHSNEYSVKNLVTLLTDSLHKYLEAQYHIWDESLILDRKALFSDTNGVTHQTPALEATPFYEYGKAFDDLEIPSAAKETLLKIAALNVGIYPKPYSHQADALEAFLRDSKNIVVATGTGSGKTESFLMPLIGMLSIEASQSPKTATMPGMRGLLLYPMNALVNDQLGRLRKLFGNQEVAEILSQNRKRRVTFGMYTSRTPYPGKQHSTKDKNILGKLVEQLFGANAANVKALLEKEGKWPSKDMDAFAKNKFTTHPNDRELYSRHEMHNKCPDLLVTNYSMLEYMLLRPVEAPIFDQTSEWLKSDKNNKFTVILDEAHMYRGAAGAEVGLLLRRLQSRLGIDRSRIKYILTSASLGSGADAQRKVIEFAGELTGLSKQQGSFQLIEGKIEKMLNGASGTIDDITALKKFPHSLLHNTFNDIGLKQAIPAFKQLLSTLNRKTLSNIETQKELRQEIYGFLEKYPPACKLANYVTGKPHTFEEIVSDIFPKHPEVQLALESLLALSAFAQRSYDNRVFLPVRLHTFYRGVSGLYVCINPNCKHRLDKTTEQPLLGRMFDGPRRECECGSRVFELLTHRDCGAAFIRAYLRAPKDNFAWHEAGLTQDNGRALMEVHFLVEAQRNRDPKACNIWMHKKTGCIQRTEPIKNTDDFLHLVQASGDPLTDVKPPIHSFDHVCPVCSRTWLKGTNKIMDLATKGEAPFAHLIATQLKLQPALKELDHHFPNQGKKNLIFSDGRQKAARLARDIPRELGQDVFRQVLLYAVSELAKIGEEAKLDKIYCAVLYILEYFNLHLFDGEGHDQILKDIQKVRQEEYVDIKECINEFNTDAPNPFKEYLLRQLGSSFYSINALTLGFVSPTKRSMRNLKEQLPELDEVEIKALAIIWIQNLLSKMAFDEKISKGVRSMAAGWYSPLWGVPKGFSKKKLSLIQSLYGQSDKIEAVFKSKLATENNGTYFIHPNAVKLELAVKNIWNQCQKCMYLSPVTLKGHCVNPKCDSNSIKPLDPENSFYLRARKTFWRDPVVEILERKNVPFYLNVCEHTAQLSFRDQDEIKSTTEEYERLFKDILLNNQEYPIDILSCTTTMEVGIDIGSLTAVGMRNVPPQRQNYQQRVGRAGRRGSAISTVITYAQNSPHDHSYFKDINKIIAGDPPLPMVDICNPRLIHRHIHAAALQHFFHTQVMHLESNKNNIFDAFGDTWNFYSGDNDFTLKHFASWVSEEAETQGVLDAIQLWVPENSKINVRTSINTFIKTLNEKRPESQEDLQGNNESLIDFLFLHGLLPSYAFPRDLCALQIEEMRNVDGYVQVKVIERPQQSLNVALSEYAPGRLVVIDKKTYRIGAVAANRPATDIDRATQLFAKKRVYNHCQDCSYTGEMYNEENESNDSCPICGSHLYETIQVIQPEMTFPVGKKPIDELDDEQIYSTSTSAQLPVTKQEITGLKSIGKYSNYYYAENQSLLMLNRGKQEAIGYSGFMVCEKCGHSVFPDEPHNTPHERHYYIQNLRNAPPAPKQCNGTYSNVCLGYSFNSDILLLRIELIKPLDVKISVPATRIALEDALMSLCEAISMASCHKLDIDLREMNAGYRLINIKNVLYADIFLYDAVAGGAGYAAIAGEQFKEILEEAKNLLNAKCCDKSCDKCLRHYGNRLSHSRLDRNLALNLLKYATEGILPPIKDLKGQNRELTPLQQVLELEGWETVQNSSIPLKMALRGKEIEVAIIPSLLDPEEIKQNYSSKCQIITTYQLQNNLAGVFANIGGSQVK